MGLVDDLILIGEKIDEAKAASSEVNVALSYTEIPAGNDYSISARMPSGATLSYSSIDVNDVTDFLDNVIAQL
jgi:hypothetical protein